MTADKIFYADPENHVIVSERSFVVNNKEYRIKNIRNHLVKVVKPVLLPGIVFGISGAFLFVTGIIKMVSFYFIPSVQLQGITIDGSGWAIVAGVLLLVGGLLMIMAKKPYYALHISTADEENDVIISRRRDYIRKITDALNRAFMLRSGLSGS
jgi:hypothetical protein